MVLVLGGWGDSFSSSPGSQAGVKMNDKATFTIRSPEWRAVRRRGDCLFLGSTISFQNVNTVFPFAKHRWVFCCCLVFFGKVKEKIPGRKAQ